MVLAEFLNEDRRARSIWRDLEHRGGEPLHRLVVVLVALRPYLDPRLSVLADPVLRVRSSGRSARDTRCGMKARPDLIEPQLQAVEQRALDVGARRGIGLRQCPQRFLDGAPSPHPSSAARNASAASFESRLRLGIARGAP